MKPFVLLMCGIFLGDIWHRFRSGNLKEIFSRMSKIEYILMFVSLSCLVSVLVSLSLLLIFEKVLSYYFVMFLLILPFLSILISAVVGFLTYKK